MVGLLGQFGVYLAIIFIILNKLKWLGINFWQWALKPPIGEIE